MFFLLGEKWHETMYDKAVFQTPSYYLLIVSQCANAIGFLNLTTFLNVHLAQSMRYDDWKIVWALSTIQIFDFIGRIFLPCLADKFKKICWCSVHIFYMIGTLGAGACMIALKDIKEDYEIFITFALLGLFSRYVCTTLVFIIAPTILLKFCD